VSQVCRRTASRPRSVLLLVRPGGCTRPPDLSDSDRTFHVDFNGGASTLRTRHRPSVPVSTFELTRRRLPNHCTLHAPACPGLPSRVPCPISRPCAFDVAVSWSIRA
jgi:hypothetical protein